MSDTPHSLGELLRERVPDSGEKGPGRGKTQTLEGQGFRARGHQRGGAACDPNQMVGGNRCHVRGAANKARSETQKGRPKGERGPSRDGPRSSGHRSIEAEQRARSVGAEAARNQPSRHTEVPGTWCSAAGRGAYVPTLGRFSTPFGASGRAIAQSTRVGLNRLAACFIEIGGGWSS